MLVVFLRFPANGERTFIIFLLALFLLRFIYQLTQTSVDTTVINLTRSEMSRVQHGILGRTTRNLSLQSIQRFASTEKGRWGTGRLLYRVAVVTTDDELLPLTKASYSLQRTDEVAAQLNRFLKTRAFRTASTLPRPGKIQKSGLPGD